MRADVVLDLAIGSGPYVPPGDMRRMGRSFWRTSRHFHIQGGRDATNGWENFSESFKLDGIESARYVSWYYTMLRQLYLSGCTLDDMAKFVAVDPVKYLAAAFDDATCHPSNPALVLAHHGMRALLGAHLTLVDGEVHWELEPRYRDLFGRIAAAAIAFITLYEPGTGLLVGWVWREPHKPYRRARAWFIEHYDPMGGSVSACRFDTPLVGENWQLAMLYDSNIFVPHWNRHSLGSGFMPGEWKPKRGLGKPSAKDAVATWFN